MGPFRNDKLCINCREIVEINTKDGQVFYCNRTAKTDMVTGMVKYKKCEDLRKDSRGCGINGRWYNPGTIDVTPETV